MEISIVDIVVMMIMAFGLGYFSCQPSVVSFQLPPIHNTVVRHSCGGRDLFPLSSAYWLFCDLSSLEDDLLSEGWKMCLFPHVQFSGNPFYYLFSSLRADS